MRVRRALARLRGRDARAPGSQTYPYRRPLWERTRVSARASAAPPAGCPRSKRRKPTPVNPLWERAMARVSRASSPRRRRTSAIRAPNRLTPSRLRLREHADAGFIRPLRRVAAQRDSGSKVVADVAGYRGVTPCWPAVFGYVRPRLAVRRALPHPRRFAVSRSRRGIP